MKRLLAIPLVVVFCLVLGTGAFAAEEHAVEAESLTINTPSTVAVSDSASASGGKELVYTDVGSAHLERKFSGKVVEVRAQVEAARGSGGDNVELLSRKQNPDGTWANAVGHGTKRATPGGYSQVSWNMNLEANATYRLVFASTTKSDLYLDRIAVLSEEPPQSPPPSGGSSRVEHEAETFTLNPAGAGMVMNNNNASGRQELYIWSNATARKSVRFENVDQITVRARGMLCGSEAPRVAVRVNDTAVGAINVSATAFADYTIKLNNISAGTHQLDLAYTNDVRTTSCDRNVLLDKVTLDGTVAGGGDTSSGGEPTSNPENPPATNNPLASEQMYVKPAAQNHARQTADQWHQQGRTQDAAQMEKIARAPSAYWFGDDTPAQVQNHVNNLTTTITSGDRLPLYVPYNIPIRDCGSYSSGGASSAQAYRDWINAFAAGIGTRKAIIVLEPDAIPDWGCLNTAQREERRQLIDYAITTLKARPNVYVYVDAGHWQSPAEIATRLQSVGIAKADGFSINVSNFQTTSDMVAYGTDVSSRIGGKHFLIDTSRNGNGPYTGGTHSGGCAPQFNPPGRALGPQPTTATGRNLVDAFVWVKVAGYSDGACGSFPSSGTWMPDVALGYAQRSAY